MSRFYEVVLSYVVGGQKNVNRFTYLADNAFVNVKGSAEIMGKLGYDPVSVPDSFVTDSLLYRIANTMSYAAFFDEIVVQAIHDDTDFTTAQLTPLTGLRGEDVQAVFEALGFRTTRVRRDIRRGTKRIGGMPVSASAANGVLDGNYAVTYAKPLVERLGQPLVCDDGGTAVNVSPVVLGREKYLVPNRTSARYAYRYYLTEDEQLQHYFVATQWELYPELRTQTSRQFGHGN